ncbi:hypothetical protein ACJ2A9_16675 [Anaerobacillus sp. MEB173]
MEIGAKVIYNNQEYIILYIYESGNCEIMKDQYTVELVDLSEIQLLQ